MTTTTNRDAVNPLILAQAAQAWLSVYDAASTQAARDEADIAFDAVLLAQGVTNPSESWHIEPLCAEHGVIHVFNEDCTECLEVDPTNGAVVVIPL